MGRRYVAIWFRHLTTDWFARRRPELKDQPFLFAAPERGRMVVWEVSVAAHAKGLRTGMVVADCRAILPGVQVFDAIDGQEEKLLLALGEWCVRYTPAVAIDMPNGLVLDASGCSHLWGGERNYLKELLERLRGFGYSIRAAMADTVGCAWAVARYGQITPLIQPGGQAAAIAPLPPAALRLEADITARLEKLGLYQNGSFMNMPRLALRRRFGQILLTRLDQAMGYELEPLKLIQPLVPYTERLPCLEPIRTATAIEIALERLLEQLCRRLAAEGKGLRQGVLKAYRIDGDVQQISIGTNRPSRNVPHLFKMFALKTGTLEPDLGFELFQLEATTVEDLSVTQEALWYTGNTRDEAVVAELLDRLAGRVGQQSINRYLPQEHYVPERATRAVATLEGDKETEWRADIPRPMHLLRRPELIEVAVRMPDYPPMHFRYKGHLHQVKKADGPERIEEAWWISRGDYRDYYCVEDEQGARFWIFRLGEYKTTDPKWYIHGFFP